jgi:hypothetical protein
MTTSQMPFFSELAGGHDGPPIPEAKRAYFQARLRNRLFNLILQKFLQEQQSGLTKAALARRIGKTPDVVNRWLGAPSNLTLDTVSDLLLGIGAEELKLETSSVLNQSPTNFFHSDWIKEDEQSTRSQPPRAKANDLGMDSQQTDLWYKYRLGSKSQEERIPGLIAGVI